MSFEEKKKQNNHLQESNSPPNDAEKNDNKNADTKIRKREQPEELIELIWNYYDKRRKDKKSDELS